MDSFQLNVADLEYDGKPLKQGPTLTVLNGTSEAPIKIHVDTDTDWAAMGPSIAGILVTFMVAWLTLRLQRRQTYANLSGLRQQWMTELRTVSSEYIQLLFKIALRVEAKPGFLASEEYIEMHELNAVIATRFHMLLSRDDSDTQAIFDLDQKINDSLDNLKSGEDCNSIITMLNELKQLIRIELESAWEDIKSDVGLTAGRKSKKNKRNTKGTQR